MCFNQGVVEVKYKKLLNFNYLTFKKCCEL